MNKSVELSQLYDVMVEMLDANGKVNFNPRGTSMLPMLHNDGDRVVIAKPKKYLKKYDLPLYRRDNGQFVLHRIVKKPVDGVYTTCGDNQWELEKNINHSQVIGVVTEFYRSNKHYYVNSIGYKIYCRLWVFLRPVRRLKAFAGKILRYLKIKK